MAKVSMAGTKKALRILDIMLWSGYSRYALSTLEDILLGATEKDIAFASAWALARKSCQLGDLVTAYNYLLTAKEAGPPRALEIGIALYEVELLRMLGRQSEAVVLCREAIARFGEDNRLSLMMSGLLTKVADRLEWLNRPLVQAGLAPIELIDPAGALRIHNIRAAAPPEPDCGRAKGSVVMPAYNASATIETAVRGILEQSWRNLELIICDDRSTDDTWELIQSFAAHDPRVIAIQHERNAGAYTARNTALRRATGDYLTVNDSDDWSHPQRISTQMHDLLREGHELNTSFGTRVFDDMVMAVNPRRGGIFVENSSSLLSRLDVVIELGGWDPSLVSADSELYDRLMAKTGAPKTILHRAVPLSFILSRPESLTKSGPIGLASLYYGARREYKEASNYWRSVSDLRIAEGRRTFPIPRIATVRNSDPIALDVLLVSDLSISGDTATANLAMIEGARAAGLSVGLYHLPRIDNYNIDVDQRIRRQIHEHHLPMIVTGEKVRCGFAIVHHPAVLNVLPDALPEVVADRTIILADQAPDALGDEQEKGGYQLGDVQRKARAAFGGDVLFAPVSPSVRAALLRALDPAELAASDWYPLLETADRAMRPLHAAAPSRQPVAGRLARDHADDWPGTAEDLRAAYLADTPVRVRLAGGGGVLAGIIGQDVPSNWTILPAEAGEPRDLVGGFDFYIHFPNAGVDEAFNYGVLEALAIGVPAILPFSLHATYGDAAIYCRPHEVQATVARYWASPRDYREQAENGLAFVRSHCGIAAFAARLERERGHGKDGPADLSVEELRGKAEKQSERLSALKEEIDALESAWWEGRKRSA